MKISKSNVFNLSLAAVAVAAAAVALAQQPSKDAKPGAGAPPDMFPKSWTEADKQACMTAMMPGKMHEWLVKGAGTWSTQDTMWMEPGAEGHKSQSTTTVTPIWENRFIKVEHQGDMGGMPFHGMGLYGYDNVTQKFQGNWADNCGTMMLPATGQLSADQKSITWTYNYTCPISKKPTTMRQVQKWVSENEQTMEMFTIDPKTGKEYKMLESHMTRKQ